ncbi:MAG: hypothetical protein JXR49_17385 [Acidobacteria bacterium]|nr:hypothetical protein [Acidobacteriota bacterium]
MIEQPGIQKAQENLLYIRQTLEAASQLTAVPGKALMATGFLALVCAAVNGFVIGAPWNTPADPRLSLSTWGIVLGLSLTIVLFGIYRKSRQMRIPIHPPLVRKLLWSLCPALFVGALMTGLAVQTDNLNWLPVIWLGCYGAAVTNGGQVSVPPVRYMGLCFLLAAAGSALSSPETGLAWIALGFGWLHIVFGAYIARRHND